MTKNTQTPLPEVVLAPPLTIYPCLNPNANPLARSGLSQAARRLPALDPQGLPLDARSPDELLAFAREYASTVRLRFWPTDTPDPDVADYTTWPALMTAPAPMAELETRPDNPPHLALFMAFLKLFGLAQEQLNAFTQRHLDFYYSEVLRMQRRPAEPDQVYLTFELARNVAEYVLPAGTTFSAGLDGYKQPLLYQTEAARIVTKASVAHARNIYLNPYAEYLRPEPNPDRMPQEVFFLPDATLGGGKWDAFGAPDLLINGDLTWPRAKAGFALASPVLRMAEGERKVIVALRVTEKLATKTTTTTDIVPAPSYTTITEVGYPPIPLRVQLSGPEGWIDVPTETTLSQYVEDPDQPQLVGPYEYRFTVTLPATEKRPVVGYDARLLDGGYATTAPVLRALVEQEGVYVRLSKLKVEGVRIDVEVNGLSQTLQLESDLGPLDASKPFMPFGPVPVPGSTLRVKSAETVDKMLVQVDAGISDWLGLPTYLETYYEDYASPLFLTTGETAIYPQNATVGVRLFNHKTSSVSPNPATVGLFKKIGNRTITGPAWSAYSVIGEPDVAATPAAGVEELLTITLQHELGHARYGKILSFIAKSPTNPSKPLNPPYTPLAKSIIVNYKATTGFVALDKPALFDQRKVQLLHQGVFGWAEEHAALGASPVRLVPQIGQRSTLLLGLKDVQPRQNVSMFFQLEEASAPAWLPAATITWSVMNNNRWSALPPEAVVDGTKGLRTSGIIELTMPADAGTTNTLLEPGLVWLKAEANTVPTSTSPSVPAQTNAMAKVVGLHLQAVRARFADHGNDPAHYAQALPAGSVTKLYQGGAGLKAVHQLYPGTGGRPPEGDLEFYTRVSERLRHKQRAVTIWDYEHLVLERFPSLAQVKCLNHTAPMTDDSRLLLATNGRRPGCITLVVMPRRGYLPITDELRPIVSGAVLAEVRAFVQTLTGPQVQVFVTNPPYQPIAVQGEVKLYRGYSVAQCRPLLAQALSDFLRPWAAPAATGASSVAFGQVVYQSAVTAFIEQQPYVNSVDNLKLFSTVLDLAPGSLPNRTTRALVTTVRPVWPASVLTFASEPNDIVSSITAG